MPKFMNLVLINLRKDRPKVPASLNFTVRTDRGVSDALLRSKHATIYFRTRGCRFSHFACTMCDYWVSDRVSPQTMITSVQAALDTLDFEPDELLLNVSGSFFDNWEVPREARQGIFRSLSQLRNTKFVFEAHSHDISREKLDECRSLLGTDSISVEMGLETANPWALKYCINKTLDLSRLTNSVSLLQEYGFKSIVNIVVGTPFLTPSEVVADAVSSVMWAFQNGIDKCVLFPINIKPWTLVHWLEEHGLYRPPPLWALVDVLARVNSDYLPRIGIAWHRTRPQLHPQYKVDNRGPSTCPVCYDQTMDLLDSYIISTDRRQAVRDLVDVECECKTLWRKSVEQSSPLSLEQRLKTNYELVGNRILGEQWWLEHGASVLDEITRPDPWWFELRPDTLKG